VKANTDVLARMLNRRSASEDSFIVNAESIGVNAESIQIMNEEEEDMT